MRRIVLLFAIMACETSDQKASPSSQTIVAAPAKPSTSLAPPEVILLSFEGDPGFRVPLNVMEKFGSFNRLLPAELRSAST